MLSTVLLAGYWPCPKKLQRFTFVSPAHSPHYPPTPDVNSSTLTAGFLFVHFCTQIFEKNDALKNDCSRKMRKVVLDSPEKCNTTYSSQKSSFSLFWGETVLRIPLRNFWWERLLSWERLPLVRENDAMSLHRGEFDHCHFFGGQTCPQMRTMGDLTCIISVKMCNHSYDLCGISGSFFLWDLPLVPKLFWEQVASTQPEFSSRRVSSELQFVHLWSYDPVPVIS